MKLLTTYLQATAKKKAPGLTLSIHFWYGCHVIFRAWFTWKHVGSGMLEWAPPCHCILCCSGSIPCRVAGGTSTSSSKLRCPFVFGQVLVISQLSSPWVWFGCSVLSFSWLSIFAFCSSWSWHKLKKCFLPKHHLWCVRAKMLLQLLQTSWWEHSLPWSWSSLIACLSPGHWFPCYEKLNVLNSLPPYLSVVELSRSNR